MVATAEEPRGEGVVGLVEEGGGEERIFAAGLKGEDAFIWEIDRGWLARCRSGEVRKICAREGVFVGELTEAVLIDGVEKVGLEIVEGLDELDVGCGEGFEIGSADKDEGEEKGTVDELLGFGGDWASGVEGELDALGEGVAVVLIVKFGETGSVIEATSVEYECVGWMRH